MVAILWRLRPLKFSVVGWLAFQWDMHIGISRLKDRGACVPVVPLNT